MWNLLDYSVSTWCFGAACVANSAPIAFVLQVRDLVLLCCGETVSGMNIRGVGRFLGVIGIGLVVGYNLGYGVGFISKLQSHCAGITFAEKVRMIEFYVRLHIKEGSQKLTISRYLKMHRVCQFQEEQIVLRIS